MLGERWNRIIRERGDAAALWHPAGQVSFRQLDSLAWKQKPVICTMAGPLHVAQGDGLAVAVGLLAGFIQGLPVQVVEKDRARRVPACAPPPGTALIKQTVGGSGVRRCQFFTGAQVLADVDRLHVALGLECCTASVAALSVVHSFGLTTTVLQTLLNGLPVHWLPTPFPAALQDALARHEQVFLPGVPAMWKAWTTASSGISRVRLAVAAGSPLSLALEAKVRTAFGLKLHNLYGTSECGAISYDAVDSPRRDGADMGSPLPGISITSDEQGVLQVESDAVGIGYDVTLPGEVFGSGRLRTCDRVAIAEGRLHFIECTGAGINVASRKLSPAEIAEKITAATGVQGVRVWGSPSRDPERVQDVSVCLDMPAEHLTGAFKSQACRHLAHWEVPRHWQVREQRH